MSRTHNPVTANFMPDPVYSKFSGRAFFCPTMNLEGIKMEDEMRYEAEIESLGQLLMDEIDNNLIELAELEIA